MPDPATSREGQGAQTEQIASIPQATADEPTTTVTQSDQQLQGLMDHLDIPAELQGQIAASTPAEPLPGTKEPELEPESPTPATEEEAGEGEGDGEGEEEEQSAAEGEQQRPDKRQKRINRLTRQKAELEAKVQAYEQHLGAQQQVPQPIPSANQRLAHISDEGTLNHEIAKASQIMEWCDANADGLTTEGADGAEKYHDPSTVAKWRREAEKVVLDAPQRRDEIRQFGAARTQYDQIAQTVWPELFDKSTPEHQAAAQLLQQYPNIRGTPQANYAAGLVIEGVRSLMARIQAANGQQPAKATRDIDPRVFTTPRVPISPHSPEPPGREAKPSSTKVLNQAMSKLQNDPDGSVESLAGMFNALEATKRTRVNSRSPVRI